MADKLEVLPGPGLVAHFADVAVWAGPQCTPALQSHLVNEAQRTSQATFGGDQLANSLIAILQRGDPEPHAPFVVVGPGANGVTLFLHGPVQVWDSGRWLSPQPVPGWMVTSIVRPWPLIVLPYGAPPPPPSQPGNPFDLSSGVVPGSGFVLLRPPSPGDQQPGPQAGGATWQPAGAGPGSAPGRRASLHGRGTGWLRAGDGTARRGGTGGRCGCGPPGGPSSRARHGARWSGCWRAAGTGGRARGVRRAGWFSWDWLAHGDWGACGEPGAGGRTRTDDRPCSGCGACPAGPARGPAWRRRGSGRPAGLPLAVQAPLALASGTTASRAPGPGDVLGVRCELGHFNHPRSTRCLRCGRAITPGTPQTTGPLPPLGVLLADDGSVWALDGGCLIGSQAEATPEVQSGALQAITIRAGPGNTMAPVHAEIQVRGWEVRLVDRGADTGTWLQPPAAPAWTRLGRNEQRDLQSGSHISCGGRVLTYLSGWPA